MNIEQFELILCDMYTMDAWSPPLIWKWKKEFKEASTKQWAIRELENYIRKRLHHRSDGSVDEFIRFTNEFAMKMARYSNHSGENQEMLDYALEYEIVDRNYSRTFKLTDETIKEIQKVKKEHIPFTDEEISKLWEHVDDKNFVDVILIQCYSGWRPQELGLIELANVDLENGTFKGGIKTEAGEDRVVPIHSKIRYLVERHYNKAKEIGSQYLFNCKDKRSGKTVMMSYQRYKAGFEMIRDELNLNPEHRPHDGRKHFVTAAKKAGIDEYAIKYMVGHKISDITEKVYTQREFDWLKEEIEKIK